MANWCSNVFAIYPKNDSDLGKAQLKRLFAQLRKVTQIDYPEGAENHNWYGLLSVMRGKDEADVYARGTINYTQWCGDYILMGTTTAWEPQDDVVRDMLDCKECTELAVELFAEEDGNEIFINTDTTGRFFLERYVLDYDFIPLTGEDCDDGWIGCDRDYFSDAKGLLHRLQFICDKLHIWSYNNSRDGIETFHLEWGDLKGTPEDQCELIYKAIKDYMEEYDDLFESCYIFYHKFESE